MHYFFKNIIGSQDNTKQTEKTLLIVSPKVGVVGIEKNKLVKIKYKICKGKLNLLLI